MNRWYGASLLTLAVSVYLVATMPESCAQDVFSCDGLMTAPIVVVFLGCAVGGLLAFVGFVRSMK